MRRPPVGQYQRSLDISELLGDQAGMATSYSQFGSLVAERGGPVEGNWLKGAASGTSALVAWDAAEGARFTDRYQFAEGKAMPR
jgi:hypothetical protein